MKPRLSDLAHFAEIVAAIAVVISLVYLGRQVNDSVVASRSAAINDANVALQSWYLELGTNGQASSIFARGMSSPEALPAEDEFQFIMILHGFFLAFQNSYFLTEEGTLDAEQLESLTAAILGVKDAPGMERYWLRRRSYLNASFASYVDDLLTRETDTSMDIDRAPPGERDSL